LKGAPRGFSLLEMVVYISLMAIVSMLLGPQLIHVWRLTARLQLRDDAHQMLNIALQRLILDLHQTRAEGVSLRADPNILAVNRLLKVQDDGLLIWAPDYSLYYLDQDRLVRQHWPNGAPAATPEETDSSLAKLLDPARLLEIRNGAASARPEILARKVLEFRTDPNQRATGLVLPLQIFLRLGPADSTVDQVSARRSVMLR